MQKIDDFHGEYLFLSNFHMSDVEFEGAIYPSAEHAYQAAKTLDEAEREKVRKTAHSSGAKRIGRGVTLRKDWEEAKSSIMFTIVHNKFQRHKDLAQKLIDTYPAELIEGNWWGDHFYGVCNGYGKNVLGHILMLVRNLLILEQVTGTFTADFDKDFLKIQE